MPVLYGSRIPFHKTSQSSHVALHPMKWWCWCWCRSTSLRSTVYSLLQTTPSFRATHFSMSTIRQLPHSKYLVSRHPLHRRPTTRDVSHHTNESINQSTIPGLIPHTRELVFCSTIALLPAKGLNRRAKSWNEMLERNLGMKQWSEILERSRDPFINHPPYFFVAITRLISLEN